MEHPTFEIDPDPLGRESIVTAMRERLSATLDRLRELRGRPVTPELVDELASIQFHGSRLSRRLQVLGHQGLLTLSARSRTSPAGLLEAALGEVEDECAARKIELSVEADRDVPELWLDPEQVVEALRCLLDNAIEAIGKDGRIRARAGVRGEQIEIAIGNDGPPFDPAILPRAFAPGVSSKRHGAGEGLGLTIVRRVTEALGGDVRIETTEDWTELTLVLPASLARNLSAGQRDEQPGRPSRSWVFPVPRAA